MSVLNGFMIALGCATVAIAFVISAGWLACIGVALALIGAALFATDPSPNITFGANSLKP